MQTSFFIEPTEGSAVSGFPSGAFRDRLLKQDVVMHLRAWVVSRLRANALRAFAVATSLPFSFTSLATPPPEIDVSLPLGLSRVTLPDSSQRLDLLVRHDGIRRPVLVIVPGSACMPAFMLIERANGSGYVSSALPPGEEDLARMGVHLAILERRNIRSFEHVYSEEESSSLPSLKRHECTDEYGGVSLPQRKMDVLRQVEYLRAQQWVGPILLVGISEGSDVAAAVAAEPSPGIQSLLLVAGAGMSQFFDTIHQSRQEGDNNGVQAAFVNLEAFISGDPPDSYQGLPAVRWTSFAIERTNLDSLMASDVPIFVVHGENDESVPIASVDSLVVEVMRKQVKRSIYYLVVKRAGHNLHEALSDPAHTIYPRYVAWTLGDHPGLTYQLLDPAYK